MFETQWAGRQAWNEQPAVSASGPSALNRDHVQRTLYLIWREHCVECAEPDCFKTCSLYVPRADGKCARFRYGIYPNPAFRGHFDFGADIHFRRWGKLEAAVDITSLAIPASPHFVQEAFSHLPFRFQNRAARDITRVTDAQLDFDEFVIECYCPSPEPFNLILAYSVFDAGIGKPMYRHAFNIQPGPNFFTIPFKNFGLRRSGYLRLCPEDAAGEKRLIFSWLDFVKFKNGHRVTTPEAPKPVGAAKIKCVAWDLDNTLWNGTLVETLDPSVLELRPGVLDLLKALDERGIIQTVVSKNDHAPAWAQIERLGLADYFVYPAINWGQKSENLKEVAARININLDTFALLDDSALQRSEVQAALPQVRVYAETDIPFLLGLAEFDVPVTDASRTRRLSYLASMRREEVQATFHGSYEDFLVDCRMEMCVFAPQERRDLLRCWELVQRTNQLNLSSRRYSFEEFQKLLADGDLLGLAIKYKDKFGDYGTVGFASVDQPNGVPALADFVLSCRVAQQRVEHMFLKWLAGRLRARGAPEFRIRLTKTSRNGPLRQVFSDLAFEVIAETEEVAELRLPLDSEIRIRDVATILEGPGVMA
jgi:FkbH-like protein